MCIRLTATGVNFSAFPQISGHLSDREWALLMTNARKVSFSSGTVVTTENEECASMYKIISGTIQITGGIFPISEGFKQ